MTGREDRDRKIKEGTIQLLSTCPEYMSGYFYSMRYNQESTRNSYIKTIRNFLNDIGKQVQDITMDDINIYIGKVSDNASHSHTIVTYSALKSFFRYLHDAKHISHNPMEHIRRPRNTVIKNEERTDFLTPKEIEMYLQSIHNGIGSERAKARQKTWIDRDMTMIRMFLYTGMRCSALVDINLDDINFTEKTVSVITKGGIYKVFNIAELMPYIKKWLITRQELLGEIDCDALFISNQRKRITVKATENIVNKYAGVISGKRITPHKLRATYATTLYNKTGDIYFVQNCMGHKNIDTTKIYIRGNQNRTQQATSIMADICK